MSAKPENTFIGSVHKKFGGKKPYIEKMYNPLCFGTPDVYQRGCRRPLGRIQVHSENEAQILPDLTLDNVDG